MGTAIPTSRSVVCGVLVAGGATGGLASAASIVTLTQKAIAYLLVWHSVAKPIEGIGLMTALKRSITATAIATISS